jgi:hypothetical protein
MKSSISHVDTNRLATNLDDLRSLKPDELSERWRRVFGAEPPVRLRRDLLIQALSYRNSGADSRRFEGSYAAPPPTHRG